MGHLKQLRFKYKTYVMWSALGVGLTVDQSMEFFDIAKFLGYTIKEMVEEISNFRRNPKTRNDWFKFPVN